MAGYGIKVETDTGRFVWLTDTGTHVQKTAKGVWKFDSEASANINRNILAKANPHANLIVKKF
jgi:hypothetical protein